MDTECGALRSCVSDLEHAIQKQLTLGNAHQQGLHSLVWCLGSALSAPHLLDLVLPIPSVPNVKPLCPGARADEPWLKMGL
jgi:hypothetical protein